MSDSCTLTINGRRIAASRGESLLDVGLAGGVLIPHDCVSGQCSTCRVRVVAGSVDTCGSASGDTVLACQARVQDDAAVIFDDVPPATEICGTVQSLAPIGPELSEVIVTLASPMDHRPGQYVSLKFRGFPSRPFSPSPRLDGTLEPRELAFQVRHRPDGAVTRHLGQRIGVGHRVRVRGPFGSAFLREGTGRLVAVAGGTGWAPIWAIAHATRLGQPWRPLVVIAGARGMANLYMRPALDWLARRGGCEVIATSSGDVEYPVLAGRPTDHLPALGPEDTVHVAGTASLVDAVKVTADMAGARCYADPFLPSAEGTSLLDRMARMLRTPFVGHRQVDGLPRRTGSRSRTG
jgi:ferredoxin-NAD(P)+ reductase (naphthalene dioxygenase ferredoxin-specific)